MLEVERGKSERKQGQNILRRHAFAEREVAEQRLQRVERGNDFIRFIGAENVRKFLYERRNVAE